ALENIGHKNHMSNESTRRAAGRIMRLSAVWLIAATLAGGAWPADTAVEVSAQRYSYEVGAGDRAKGPTTGDDHASGGSTVASSERGSGGAFMELGPLLGHVGPGEARLWAKASGPALLSLQIGPKPDLLESRNIKGPSLEAATDFVGQVQVTGLQPARRYYYAVLLNGKSAMAAPYPSFVTAPAGDRGHVRFAFGSCVGYNGFDSAA